jgi:hypothetical protein
MIGDFFLESIESRFMINDFLGKSIELRSMIAVLQLSIAFRFRGRCAWICQGGVHRP